MGILVVVGTLSSVSFFLAFQATQQHQFSVRALQEQSIHNNSTRSSQRETRSSNVVTALLQKQYHPRLVFLQDSSFDTEISDFIADEEDYSSSSKTMKMMILPVHSEMTMQPVPSEKAYLKDCIPLADWMTKSFPNCNNFHEMNLPNSIYWNETQMTATTTVAEQRRRAAVYDNRLTKLGRGWFRTTWRWDRHLHYHDEAVVLKSLRLERDFLHEYFELHNRDAVAMERLTASPHVVDVYGYCGQSAINELADFPIENMQYLEKLSRRMRGMYNHESLVLRLGIAASIARGLADVHRAGGDGRRALMVHYDINPRNIALFTGARAKINDFNIAEFLHYNPKTNETCGFPSRMHAPWWRSPEEVTLDEDVLLNEKVDIYALGASLFHLFTSFSPRGKMVASREETVRQFVLTDKRPVVLAVLRNSTDPIAITFRDVLDRCYEPDPSKRPSAEEVATILESALLYEKAAVRKRRKDANSEDGDSLEQRNTPVHLASNSGGESEDVDETNLEEKG
jgi:serine/threonine protein kinase